jgi:hypothetical protein
MPIALFERPAGRHILQGKDLPVRQPHGPLDENLGMDVKRDGLSAVRLTDQFHDLRQPLRVVEGAAEGHARVR